MTEAGLKNRPAPVGRAVVPRSDWWRLPVALGLGLVLFGLGQFDEFVFAGLTRGWQAGLAQLGPAAQRLMQPSGLSTHGVAVGLSYRLLYVLVSLLLLHVLLRGHHTRASALAYALAFGLSLGLLLLGQRAGLAGAAVQGHRLLDLLSSPLALLLLYGLALLRWARPPAATMGSRGATAASRH